MDAKNTTSSFRPQLARWGWHRDAINNSEQSYDAKVLMLTDRSLVSEKVSGLRRGADEYMSKPFSSAEFIARVENLMRRSRRITSTALPIGRGALLLGEAQLEYGKKTVQLSKKEAQLIDMFIRQPKHQLTRESIASNIWTIDRYPSASSIDTFMKRLRTKLSATPLRILTRYNLGYELSIPQ
jgi:DNA-binding response OmpR family regulator